LLECAFGYLAVYVSTKPRIKVIPITFENGITLLVNKYSRELLGYFEVFLENEYRACEGFVARDGFSVVDVGANIGCYTVMQCAAARAVRCFSFEPDPQTFARLVENVRNNCRSHVVVLPTCVSSRDGEVDFRPHRTSVNSHVASSQSGACAKVPSSSLDRFVRDSGLERIDILKIDVEGHECEVLDGGREHALPMTQRIVLEFHGREVKTRAHGTLLGLGFCPVAEHGDVGYYERRS